MRQSGPRAPRAPAPRSWRTEQRARIKWRNDIQLRSGAAMLLQDHRHVLLGLPVYTRRALHPAQGGALLRLQSALGEEVAVGAGVHAGAKVEQASVGLPSVFSHAGHPRSHADKCEGHGESGGDAHAMR